MIPRLDRRIFNVSVYFVTVHMCCEFAFCHYSGLIGVLLELIAFAAAFFFSYFLFRNLLDLFKDAVLAVAVAVEHRKEER